MINQYIMNFKNKKSKFILFQNKYYVPKIEIIKLGSK